MKGRAVQALDRSWQGVSLLDQRHQIAADAEQSAGRAESSTDRTSVRLADFGNAQVEFAAKTHRQWDCRGRAD